MPPQEVDAESPDANVMVERKGVSCAWSEARLLINIAVPTIVIQVGSTLPGAMTASYIGRQLGSVYLDGFTLATLTGNLLTLALLWGLYSASDTLSPQAFGAGNYKEVGLIAIRGFVGSMLVLIPINSVLFFVMEDLLVMFGEEQEPSRLAAQWYRVYIFALPFAALYMVIWKFLSSQGIMMPIVLAMLFSTAVILPASLQLLVPTFGYMGSAFAILIYQVAEPLLLLAYLAWCKPYHPETWTGLSHWRDAIAWEPFKAYMHLGCGGMLASGEWIWWEFVSLIIGTLGVIPLSAHTIPTQFLMVCYNFPLGLGTALSIRLGSLLPVNVPRSKQLVYWCSMASFAFFTVLCTGVYVIRDSIFAIFTKDPLVLAEVEKIWWKVVAYYFALCTFGIVTGVAVGLGMQWTLGVVNLAFLWFVALPGLYVHSVVYHGGLGAAWSWIYPPYFIMNVILVHRIYVSDWDAISHEVRMREGMDDELKIGRDASEETPLLSI